MTLIAAVGLSYDDFQSTTYSRIDYIRGLLRDRRLDSSLRWSDAGGAVQTAETRVGAP